MSGEREAPNYWLTRDARGTRYAPGGLYPTRARGLARKQYRSEAARERRRLRQAFRRLKGATGQSFKQWLRTASDAR